VSNNATTVFIRVNNMMKGVCNGKKAKRFIMNTVV